MERVKLRFKDIVRSSAYQVHAADWAKVHLSAAVAAAVAAAWFSHVSLGANWLWVLPTLLFGIPLLISLPTMLVHVWLVAIQSGHMSCDPSGKPAPADALGQLLQSTKSVWSIGSVALAAYTSFRVVTWVGG